MTAEPRWATPRTPARKTLGTAAFRMSRVLSQSLLPWQRQVLDVAMELRGDGRFAYRNVTLTIPRQNGKTTALLAMVCARALLEPGTRIVYCAQSASEAKKKWRDDWQPAVAASPLAGLVHFSWGAGDERMVFANGSYAMIAASTEKAAHGKTDLDLALIDEAFAYKDSRLEQALRPAMLHEPNAQIWIVSTAGTPLQSPYLWDKVKSGREFVDEGYTSGTCYFEWSAPEDAAPGDPETWRACMPALGLTLTEEVISGDYESLLKEGKLGEFKRAYLNQWTTIMGDPLVPLDLWESLERADATRPADIVLGVDVGPKDTAASVVAVGQVGADTDPERYLQSTVLANGSGTGWLLSTVADYVARYDRPYVVVDEKHCEYLIPELERVVGFDRLLTRGVSDLVAGYAFWLKLVRDSKLTHRGEPELKAALIGAGQRSLADGWAFSRTKSSVDITPLVAQALAASFWLGPWQEVDEDA